MEIRVNTGPSSPRENKSSVIWEFSSGASIDNNLAQPYIQQKYKAFFFCSRIPFRAETLFGNRFLKVKNPPPPVFSIYRINFEERGKLRSAEKREGAELLFRDVEKKKKLMGDAKRI